MTNLSKNLISFLNDKIFIKTPEVIKVEKSPLANKYLLRLDEDNKITIEIKHTKERNNIMFKTALVLNQMEAVVGGSVTMPTYKKTSKDKAKENKTKDKTGKIGNLVYQACSQAEFLVSMAWDWITD